jgi:hypothetical protein
MKKWLFSITTFFVSLALCAAIGFFSLLFLAGPHSSIVPVWAEKIVLLLGWVFAVGVPLLLARNVYVKTKN